MDNLFFVIITIFFVTGMIYILYKIMLNSEGAKNDKELQISAHDLLTQINILSSKKKYSIAENLAKTYLQSKPNEDIIRMALAKIYFEERESYDALEQAKIVSKHNPKNTETLIFVANCFIQASKPLYAIDVLEDVVKKEPVNETALGMLAKLYLEMNQKRSAIKIYKRLEECLESNQEKVQNKEVVADIYKTFNEFDLAIKEYLEILEMYPDNMNVKKKLIEMYQKTGNFDGIISNANDMILSGDSGMVVWGLKTLIFTYKFQKNYDKALEYAEQYKEHPLATVTEANQYIAEILLEQGKFEESISILRETAINDPKDIQVKKSLANAHAANKEFELAVDIYKNILEVVDAREINDIKFDISNMYANWGTYLFSMKENEECFRRFSLALKYNEQNSDIYYQLGEINKAIKNYNEAIIQFKKAIELNPKVAQYYYSIAECYDEISSFYEEKKYLAESLNYETNNANVYYKLGVIYEMQGDFDKAITNVKKSIEIDPSFISAKYKMALMLEHSGNKDDAIAIYEEILRLNPDNKEVENNLKMLRAQ